MQSAIFQKQKTEKSNSDASGHSNGLKRQFSGEKGARSGMPVYLQPANTSIDSETTQEESEQEADENLGQVQTKLTIGAADDPYEREADNVADAVMRQSTDTQSEEESTPPEIQSKIQPKIKLSAHPDTLRAKSGNHKTTPRVTPQVKAVVSSPGSGEALNDTVRDQVESVLGADLSSVRVHSNGASNEAADSINARAFAHGSNIWLGTGQRADDTRLMAHEATHTVQQGTAGQARSKSIIQRAWYNPVDVAVGAYQGAKRLGGKAVGAVKGGIKAVLKLAAKLARKIPGYKLLTLIINGDPISGESVNRGELLSEIFESVPYGKILAKNIKHLADSAGKIMSWLGEQFTSSDFTWAAVKKAFGRTVDSLRWHDIVVPPKAAYKIIDNFVIPIGKRAIKFIGAVAKKLFGAIFQWLLEKIGPHAKRVMGLVGKVASVVYTIGRDPIAFAKNLGNALEKGFYQFRDNFLKKHLPRALAALIFGPMNITVPDKLTFGSIFNLTLQVLDLTYSTGLRPKLVKRLGERRVSFIERSVSLIRQVKEKGIGVIWEKMKLFMGNLKDLVLDKIKGWLITKVVIAGVKWIAGLIVPGGAFIKAIESVYAMFKVFMERWQQIEAVISKVANSIGLIAAGSISTAANAIEKVLGNGLSLLIAFLANLMGLGGIGTKVREIIKAIKGRIHDAMDRLVGYIIKLIGKVFGKAKFAVGKALQWWRRRKSIKGGDNKTLTISISGGEKAPNVMIKASPKKRFSTFINKRKSEMTTVKQKAALKIAEAQVEIIENRRKKPAETEEQIAGIKLAAFNSLADQLLIMTGGTKTPISVFSFGALNVDQGGTEMTASILSKDHPKGSTVTDKPFIWTDLYHMRKGVGSPYYVQGHLLNNGLGGPGKRYNLSPLTTRANREHFDHVEKNVKTWVNKKKVVMYYHVKVNYPSLGDSSRLKELRGKDESARTKTEKRELAVLTRQRLATTFSCNAHKLKFENSKWIKDAADSTYNISYDVTNN